jgi:cholesterol transport system auxiliary component
MAGMLAGCVSGLNSKLPVQQSYVLHSALSEAGVPPLRPIPPASAAGIRVLLPSAAPGLATEGIAVLRPGERLDYYQNARWAADLPSMLQTLVIDSLRNAGRFTTVESDAGPFSAEYVLSLELQDFEAVYEGAGAPSVRVALVCTLGRRTDREVIVSFTSRSEVHAEADRMQSVIAAFEQASGQALGQLAASIAPPAQ